MAKRKTATQSTTVISRPPIVAVLGHVDHGKTTLLDTIRNANVAKGESGGITQHIGAYQVEVDTKEGKRKITFIDTPGHEAFSKMRSRGAAVTDLVILVISAVDGVQPQTEESLNHIKKAGVPFIVAATKMDLPEANIDRVKKHLAKVDVLTEGYGGEVVVVPVSAVSKKGINELLEMILLISEMKGLKGTENDPFNGVIIESRLDNRKGPLATIIVKKGFIQKGDDIYLRAEKTRIRAMFDEFGKEVLKALPSRPVILLGFKNVPPVGEVVSKEKTVQNTPSFIKPTSVQTEEKQLKIIIKADTVGSLEAILGKLDQNIFVLEASLGEIGESEILRAQTAQAFVIGFNVKVAKAAKQLATQEKVHVKTYTIIYELLDEIYDVAEFIKEGEKEEILGEGRIIAKFSTSEGAIAGISIVSGKLSKGDKIKLVRGDQEIGTGKILNLKQGKKDISKIEQGKECGAKLSSNLDFQLTDVILSVKLKEIKLS